MRSRTLIAHLAGEHRRAQPDPARITALREQIRETQLTEWVERQLATAPPLSQETRDKLAALLSGACTDESAPRADKSGPGADRAA